MSGGNGGLAGIARELGRRVGELEFGPPVAHVYNPLQYAWDGHRAYLDRVGDETGRVVLLGMNPGPWGMAQTGVPFGDVVMVREWLGIEAQIEPPENEHPARPIEGFDCSRREVSGSRLWGWAADTFDSPEAFFGRFAVLNYCPLAFLEESGRNRTPDRLPLSERRPLLEVCDEALVATLDLLEPSALVGIGRFAEQRARAAAERVPRDRGNEEVPVGYILHPSPANPEANRGWEGTITEALEDFGIGL